MLDNLKLAVKIGGGFGLLIALTLIQGAVGMWQMTLVSGKSSTLSNEYVPEVAGANKLESNLLKAMYDMRGYGYSAEEKFLDAARQYLKDVHVALGELEELEGSARSLTKLKASIDGIHEGILKYEGLVDKTREANAIIRKAREQMDAGAATYVSNATAFLQSQEAKLNRELATLGQDSLTTLRERALKVRFATSLLDLGQQIRVANFKSQSLRDITAVQEALSNFSEIQSILGQLRRITREADNQKQLEQVELGANQYQKAIQTYIEEFNILKQLGIQRDQAGRSVLAKSSEMAGAGLLGTEKLAEETTSSIQNQIMFFVIGLTVNILVGVVAAFFITSRIMRPVRQAVRVVEALAKGDFTQKSGVNQQDEIGQLARAIDETSNELRGVMKELSENATTLSAASEQLISTANQLTSGAEEMTAQSNTVAGAGEQLSMNVRTMASTAEEISQSANNVASAVEEMSASINEVAQNCTKESQIAGLANTKASETRKVIAKLGESANEIGKVVELISSIADQTNLLALNATIEAASAGEAGKGFAVVANEVKELARQSGNATEQIASQIANIQRDTQFSVEAIEEVSKVIEEVNQIAGTIAAAVEEQSATTNEISRTMSNVSSGTQDMARSIGEASSGAHEVSSSIQTLNQAAGQTAAGATETNASATELDRMADRLREMVAKFKI